MAKLVRVFLCWALSLVLICGALPVLAEQAPEAQTATDDPLQPTTDEPVTPPAPDDMPTETPEPTPIPTPDPTPSPTPDPTIEPEPTIAPESTATTASDVTAQTETPPPPPEKPPVDPTHITLSDVVAGGVSTMLAELGIGPDLYDKVQKVTISSGTVGEADFAAFRDMKNLQSLILTDAQVENNMLPDGALKEMRELRELRLPAPPDNKPELSRVLSIGAAALKNCVRLKDLSALQQITSVGDEAFYGCSSLQKLKMPTLVTIGERAFYDCTKIAEFSFASVATIGADAFNGCAALGSANMPSIASIGNSAFSGCSALSAVKLGKGAVTIGDSAFSGAGNLSTASISTASSIGASAFEGCKKLANLSLSGCRDLGDLAFAGCRRLEKVDWPSGFDSIGESVFDGCALDFSKGFPAGLNTRRTGVQSPRVYFSLSKTKGTIYAGDNWNEPSYSLLTRRGASFKSIIGADWVSPDVGLPKVTRSPKSIDTSDARTVNISYTIPNSAFANTHKIVYKLTIRENQVSAPTASPEPTVPPIEEDEHEPDEYQADMWAMLPGLTLTEIELALGRQIYDPELRGEVADYALQTAYPIDLDAIAGEGARIPLLSGGYRVGELLIARHLDDPNTDYAEEEGLLFTVEPIEGAQLLESTLQIASTPEQIDPYLAQHPYDLPYAVDMAQTPVEDVQEPETDAEQLCFYPLDELLDAKGIALLYVNAQVRYDPTQVPVYIMDIAAHESMLEMLSNWIIVPSDE